MTGAPLRGGTGAAALAVAMPCRAPHISQSRAVP